MTVSFLLFFNLKAKKRKPGGAKIIVGTVDKKGSGVPFMECTTYTKNDVIAETVMTETGIARYGFLIKVNNCSKSLTISPPKKKV